MTELSPQTNSNWDKYDWEIYHKLSREIEDSQIFELYDFPLIFVGSVESLPTEEEVYPENPSAVRYFSTANCIYKKEGWINHYYFVMGEVIKLYVTRGKNANP